MTSVLKIRDLTLGFRKGRQTAQVLHGISMHVNAGEKVALVGESGSGKSVTAQLALGRLQQERGTLTSGEIEVVGHDLIRHPEAMAPERGHRVTMIFQDPTSALNPVFRIGEIFTEVLRSGGRKVTAAEARDRALKALAEVHIPDPARALDSYPFQLSGGMNQRVMIAMALANEPELLLADEPGTALDVTVQAQTLRLMDDLVTEKGTSVLFISHGGFPLRPPLPRFRWFACIRLTGPSSPLLLSAHTDLSSVVDVTDQISGAPPNPSFAHVSLPIEAEGAGVTEAILSFGGINLSEDSNNTSLLSFE